MTDEERAWATRNTWDSSCWTAGERGAIAKCIADELAAVRAESEAEIQALKAQVAALVYFAERVAGHGCERVNATAGAPDALDKLADLANAACVVLADTEAAAREHDERLVRRVAERAARMAAHGMSHTMVFERCDCAECAIRRLTLSDIQEKP